MGRVDACATSARSQGRNGGDEPRPPRDGWKRRQAAALLHREQEWEQWRRKRTAPRRTARWRATGAREGEERVLEGIGERGRIGKD